MSKAASSSELIVTSFRLPFVTTRRDNGTIGRTESRDEWARSLAHVVTESQGQWVGWAGSVLQRGQPIPGPDPEDTSPTAALTSQQVQPVYLGQVDKEQAYGGCCKSSLWPLLHSMADRATFDEDDWSTYRKVNNTFAEATLTALRESLKKDADSTPLIWIHDYHLMEVPDIVRRKAKEENLRCKIGFFMHVPFPPWDMIKIHPWKDIFLQGILGSDLVSFQCEDYLLNFIDCCERGLGTRVDRGLRIVEHDAGGRNVKIRSMPLGVPFARFETMAASAPKSSLIRDDVATILGIDSVDFTKGLNHKLKAFEKLLEKYHIHRGAVSLVQICLPTRTEEGQQLRETLETMVHNINSKYGTSTWTPVHLVSRPLSDLDLAGLYRDADIALITPLRDGMNLSAKEFVSCRIQGDKPGVLILSPFVGAADLMQEALIVNPYEVNKVADYLHNSLTMSEAEAEVRMISLRGREKIHDLNFWMRSFLREMDNLVDTDGELSACLDTIKFEDFDEMLNKYLGVPGWEKLCLLLDYDGTLAPHGSHPDLTILPKQTKEVLERLSEMPEVFVSIITGRSIPDIKTKVSIKNITYAGNHGIDIVHPDGSKFMIPMPAEVEEKARWLLQHLQQECCVSGAWVENKGVVLAFHHEAWKERDSIDPELKERTLSRARQLMTDAGFRIGMSDGGLVTEAKPPVQWNKGNAAIYILRSAFGVNWSDRLRIIYAGDDLTDEDAMQALKGMAYSFRVVNSGLVQTVADHRLPNTQGIETMLKWVENYVLQNRKKAK
ncbi:alpha,alpha-trehalose-phosphate synthase [UDP-forming] [Eurytemora carolleeae]|uniref:alpha,alpha-trehalose-phosphate synthase [UDP-forming] n=1 Tax=Eurytemora carolleeae TaxID=1294199 RepID=UPI000C78C512|nr:alpha,alpha-trehalose-phosphate synthase [UDP-forming] [Eurytemora carolleeae]|eukprot:XP_023330996.1 alpha,alpha-trehalose-phosphate synthase [UDP-forming]-like [Eurytemora affinis]